MGTSASEIMNGLESLRGRYVKDGVDLFGGGLMSYIKPEKFKAVAVESGFVLHATFPIDDESLLVEVERNLSRGRMVIVAARTKDEKVDMYLEP